MPATIAAFGGKAVHPISSVGVEVGIPVLMEKPMATCSTDAEKLVLKAAAADVPILVGHHGRRNPLVQNVKNELDRGKLGSIVSVAAQCWLYKPDDYFDVAWRKKPGAGPIFINLIHDIDLLRHLCGVIESVIAVTSNQTRSLEVEDTAAIILRFRHGALVTTNVPDTIVSPWSWEMTSGENPVYPQTKEVCYQIGGTKGSIAVPKNSVWH